jgi:hypothetical protein
MKDNQLSWATAILCAVALFAGGLGIIAGALNFFPWSGGSFTIAGAALTRTNLSPDM